MKQLFAIEPGMTEHDDSPDADEQAIKKLEMYTSPPVPKEEKEKREGYRPPRMRRRRKYEW